MSGWITPFLIHSAVQAITPILLAALAGSLCARAGVFNVALEGKILIGAFAAVVASYYTQSATGGVAAAMIAAMVFSLILAYGATVFRGDHVVICIGMNLLASGLTAYLLRVLFGVSGVFSDPAIVSLGKIRIPAIRDIPIIGWGFFSQTVVTWIAWGLVVAISLILFRTPIGLRLRGVGEQPDAAETLGVDVTAYRIAAVIAAGGLCGLAGAQLSLGAVSVFAEDMSAGRGWIAVVAVMLGRANPIYVAGACALFGLADAMSVRLQGEGLPNQLTDISPYAVTLAALVISHRKRRRAALPSSEVDAASPGGVAEPQPDTR
ncbi:MAG TPA: ABC transporter permease [Roseiarcus sp.]|nr:ABC transporter permease [Roseiarcus sp.]